MKLKTEQYKGYAVKFTEKILGNGKIVVGEFPSKITGRVLGAQDSTKDTALTKCKKMIDKEIKIKGLN